VTKVRSRLLLAFAYILVVVLVALGVPLAVNLEQRATLELQTEALIQAQGIASAVGSENLRPRAEDRLDSIVIDAANQVDGRVVVVDEQGILVADSQGPDYLGSRYATPSRPEIVTALGGRPATQIRFSSDLGMELLTTAVPIQDEGRTVGAVRITKPMADVAQETRRATLGLVAIGLAGLAAGLLLAFAMASSLARPLRRLADASRRLGEGDLSTRAEDVTGADEIEQLGRSFDVMADQMERTVRAQREFVANASHQLRTPLTGIKLRLESAIEGTADERLRHDLEAADREVDRLSDIVDRLLLMARDIEDGKPTVLDADAAVEQAVARWRERATLAGATLSARTGGGAAQGNPTDLAQVLDALIHNAITYAPGPVSVGCTREDARVVIAVQDEGPGIASDELERVTERFYRGHGAPPGGSGLGLTIARELVERWGGSLEVSTHEGGGTRVEVRLRPAAEGLTDP
jgi:signal transduction histidine kinase